MIHAPAGTIALDAPDLKPRVDRAALRPGTLKHPYAPRPLRSGTVTAHDLQGALVLILCLYASLAVLNLQSEFTTLIQQWHSFIEFLAHALL